MFSLTTVISRSFSSASRLFTPRRAQSAPYTELGVPRERWSGTVGLLTALRYISSQATRVSEAVFGHHAPVLHIASAVTLSDPWGKSPRYHPRRSAMYGSSPVRIVAYNYGYH